jgi:hypothetical protein
VTGGVVTGGVVTGGAVTGGVVTGGVVTGGVVTGGAVTGKPGTSGESAGTGYDVTVSTEPATTERPAPMPAVDPTIAQAGPSPAAPELSPPSEALAVGEPPSTDAAEARPTAPPPPPAMTSGTAQHPGVAEQPRTPSHEASDKTGASLLRWLALAAVAALLLQLVRFALRPLRRLVTLRHLRRPFWDETIDQRVSNAWQLALIGLRDAGWRAGTTEAPHELARRVGVDGLDRCATVLERARHGVGLDADDLAQMQTAADVAYRAARTGVGGMARLIGWLRWPLT